MAEVRSRWSIFLERVTALTAALAATGGVFVSSFDATAGERRVGHWLLALAALAFMAFWFFLMDERSPAGDEDEASRFVLEAEPPRAEAVATGAERPRARSRCRPMSPLRLTGGPRKRAPAG